MAYLTRNKVYEKIAPSKEAKKIYIICEGAKTEINYFKYFQGFSSNIDIIPIPNVDDKSNPFKLKQNAELLFFENESSKPVYILSEEYGDEVWFAIDTDRWNEGNKINMLIEFCDSNNKSCKQWFIAQSNPSFEIWLYYHFNNQSPKEDDVKKHETFKEFVNNEIKGGFDCRSMPVEVAIAIENSSNNFSEENGQPVLYTTGVHFLAKIILPFVQAQLDKAKALNA